MGKAAFQSSLNYSKEKVIRIWINLFKNILKQEDSIN